MNRPLKALPLIQNWDCHACGNCCTDYVVPVSPEERRRIEAQGWSELPEFRTTPLFVRSTPWWMFWRKRYQLNQREGHRCIFLGDDNLCRIHGKFGFETKPFACRLYPYILVPVGDHWRLSLRYACPSATANRGRPLEAQLEEINALAREMATWDREEAPQDKTLAKNKLPERLPPTLDGRKRVDWKDLSRIIDALVAIVRDSGDFFPRRMLRCLAVVRLCQQARFDKITGARLKELLELLSNAANSEVPRDLAAFDPPGWIGRLLFRSTAAVYLRKDSGTRIGVAARGRIALILAMMRMTRGSGRLPLLQQGLPECTFAELEQPIGKLRPETQETLARYYEVKLSSMQFCGPACYHLPVWEGVAALALTLPVVLWLARGYRNLEQAEAVQKAINVVDENFGYNPLLGHLRQRFANRILFSRGELDRLIAWYSR